MRTLPLNIRQYRILSFFNLLFGLIIAGMYANALIYPNMGVDAGFYLRVTECVLNGAIPEHDLRIVYPPLVFYMLLPIKLMVGKSIAFELFLGYMFLFQFLSAFLIFKITGYYSEKKYIRIFAGLIYLFLSIKLEGEYFILEPFINFWGLLSLLMYLQYRNKQIWGLFLAGLFSLMAAFTKQYGLAYVALILMLLLIDNGLSLRKLASRALVFGAGLLGGLILFIILFRIGYGVYYDFLAGGRLAYYGEKSISSIFWGLAEYLKIAPYLLLMMIPLVFKNLVKYNLHSLPYLSFVLLLSFQLYFNRYDHYFIPMLPGLIFTGVMIFDIIYPRSLGITIIVLLASLLVNELYIGARTKSMLFSTQTSLKTDMELAKKINLFIPEGSRAYLFSNVKLYYLCHLDPAIPEKYGFSYNNALTVNNFTEIMNETEYVVIRKSRINELYPLVDGNIEISQLLKNNRLSEYANVDNYMIYKRNK